MEGCEGLAFVTQDQQVVVVKEDFIQSHATGGVIVENKEVLSLQLNQQNIISHLVGSQQEDVGLAEFLPVKKYSNLTSILRSRLHGVDLYGDDSNVFGVLRLAGDGHTWNADPRLCVNLELVGDKISVKTFVTKLEILDASISDLCGIGEEMERLKATKLCQGMKEELILPMLASFGNSKLMTALFLIEKLSTGFIYKSRQCKSVAEIGGDVCKTCKDFFDNLLFVNTNCDIKDAAHEANESEDKYSEPVQACFDDSSDDDFGEKVMSSNIAGGSILKKKSMKLYNCEFCDSNFKLRKSYLKHVETVHETLVTPDNNMKAETKKEKKYFCEDITCEKSFTSLVRLNKHLRISHHINTPSTDTTAKAVHNIRCPFCQDEFKVPEGKIGCHRLRSHLRSVHSKLEVEESYQQIIKEEAAESVICQACGKSYTNQGTLESHVKLMHSDNTEMESCHICGKSFKKGGSTLWGHIRTHEDGGHICPICGAKFKVKSYLQRHIKSHDPDCKRYECDICGDKFTRPYLMKQHQEFTHKKNLPFKCNECGKSLRSNTFLKIHMRSVHSKEKPFPCEICGFRSSRVDNLNIHRTKVHHITVRITRSQLQQLVLEGKHPFCTNPDDIPAF